MKAFLNETILVLEAIWSYMKTVNVYAGAIPEGAKRIEYRTAEQWEHPTR